MDEFMKGAPFAVMCRTVALAVLLSTTLRAQGPTCPKCVIQTTPVIRLGDSNVDGGFFPGSVSAVLRDSRGQFWVSFSSQDAPQIYDSLGKPLGRAGGLGSGPGEMRGGNVFWNGPADSVFIADRRNNKVLVFTASRKFVREFNLPQDPGLYSAMVGSRFVLTGTLRSRESVGFPAQLYNADGRWERSLGPSVVSGPRSLMSVRVVAAASDTSLWLIDPLSHAGGLFAVSGAAIAQLQRPDWFEPSNMIRNPFPDSAPQMRVNDARSDAAGRLWMIVSRPDVRWKTAGEPDEQAQPKEPGVRDFDRYFDTEIEVRDRTGALIASRRIDASLSRLLAGGFAIGPELPGSEGVRMIWKLTLIEPQTGRIGAYISNAYAENRVEQFAGLRSGYRLLLVRDGTCFRPAGSAEVAK
jgi:hypothetical protein